MAEWQVEIVRTRQRQQKEQEHKISMRELTDASSGSDYSQVLNSYSWVAKVMPDSVPFDTHQTPKDWRDLWLASFAFPKAAEIYEKRASDLERIWKHSNG